MRRIDGERPVGIYDRLSVLLQGEMRGGFPAIPKNQSRIVRAQSDGPVIIFEAFFELAKVQVVIAKIFIGFHRCRVQGESALAFGNRFVDTPLEQQDLSSNQVSIGVIRIKVERLRCQVAAPVEGRLRDRCFGRLRLVTKTIRQNAEGADIIRIGVERLLAKLETRCRFPAENPAFCIAAAHCIARSAALGFGRSPFETGGFGVRELNFQCVRQMRDDLVLHLQYVGARGVELFGP